MPIENENLRNALAETAIAISKNQEKVTDKIVKKLDEIENEKREEKLEHKGEKEKETKDILGQIKAVETAIKNKKNAETISIDNPEAITGDLKKGLEDIINTLKEELKNFDKNITVKNDFSNFASLFKTSQDKTAIIEALKKIEDKLSKEKEIDYTLILSDIANAVEDKEAVTILKQILNKELNVLLPNIFPVDLDPNLIEKDRVKVVLRDDQVSKMAAMATMGRSGVATEEKQNTQILNEQTLISLIETMQELVSRISFLAGVRGSSADLRVTPLSLPTLSAVTTVSTLTNQTNIGGFSASTIVGATQNNIAIQSNINNVTA